MTIRAYFVAVDVCCNFQGINIAKSYYFCRFLILWSNIWKNY